MAERVKVFEPLPGELVEYTEVEVDGADVAFLGPKVTNNVILYAFRGNLEVTVDYNDDARGYHGVVEQSRTLAAAGISANRFEQRVWNTWGTTSGGNPVETQVTARPAAPGR